MELKVAATFRLVATWKPNKIKRVKTRRDPFQYLVEYPGLRNVLVESQGTYQ